MPEGPTRRKGSGAEGLAALGIAALAIACCAGGPLIIVLASSVAAGTLLGVGGGVAVAVALAAVVALRLRARRRTCERPASRRHRGSAVPRER